MSDVLSRLLEPSEETADGSPTVADPFMETSCPLLHALLSLTSWKGEKRQPATLILFAEDGRYKVTLNDRQSQRVSFVTLDTTEGMLEYIDRLLADDGLEWRKAKGQRYQR